jgi:hypothetical protein
MAAAAGSTRVPVRLADGFLLAMDAFMRRTGQGEHIPQSVLELAGAPKIAPLRAAARRLVEKHPLLVARLRRNWRTWLPYWQVPNATDRALPVGLWREKDSPGALGAEAREVTNAMGALEGIMAQPLDESAGPLNARLDVIERRDGRCLVALTWRHLLVDGKGAELLLAELARLCDGIDSPPETVEPPPRSLSLREQFSQKNPAVNRLEDLARLRIKSVSGPKSRRGRARFQVVTLDAADSDRLKARAEAMTGALFPMGFYVACAARAHDRVFQARGQAPGGFVTTVPIQTRKRGARGPLFHNQVTVFFFGAARAELATMEAASQSMKQQFADMTRRRLDESFNAILALMTRLPAALFMRVVRWQFKGEICSFFHSHTGAFAPEIAEFAGARITNGFHLPCLCTPPGSGIFFSERDGRVSVTFSWRNGCLSDAERRLIVAQTLEDAVGAPRPELIDANL